MAPMVRPEILAYLKANLDKFPVEALRRRLETDGVSDAEFDEALKAALPGSPRPATKGRRLGRAALAGGFFALVAVAGLIFLSGRKAAAPPLIAAPVGDGGFVGRAGWVVHLPRGYVAVSEVKDSSKDWEVVHFCRSGTDPTNFLNEGLFGQLGIVRLEVQQSPLAGNLNGPDVMSQLVSGRLQRRGDKFAIKSRQVSGLRGIQVTIEPPNVAVEVYLLGEKHVYFFTAGQDDDILRDIVASLRDPHAEN